ncbi:MAG TPA: hypothetical protein VFA26_06430, partial [Gemmataceae bacterium]|nr:hypothetical protein [Gemmataceae bacterium]
TIRFYPKDGGMYTAVIRPDGKYEAPDLPVGEMAVTIETESANPNRKTPDYNSPGGGGMGMYGKAGGGAPQQKDRAMKMSPIPEGAPKAEGAYVKIPAKYADKSTSGLSVTLNKGKQTKDFALTD